ARLQRALRAGVRGVLLQTPEEDRALEALDAVAEQLRWPAHTWSAAGVDHGSPRPLRELLDRLRTQTDDALWVLLDAAPELEAPGTRRLRRALAQRGRGPAVVLVEPSGPAVTRLLAIPELVVDALPPPGLEELSRHIAWVAGLLAEHEHPLARERLVPHAS